MRIPLAYICRGNIQAKIAIKSENNRLKSEILALNWGESWSNKKHQIARNSSSFFETQIIVGSRCVIMIAYDFVIVIVIVIVVVIMGNFEITDLSYYVIFHCRPCQFDHVMYHVSGQTKIF